MLPNNREYAELNDLCKFLNEIQIDSRLGFSVVSFFRQAIILREMWLGDACVRGRLCITPGHGPQSDSMPSLRSGASA